MKWINAEQQVTVTIYDEEHEEHLDRTMSVEEMLDTYTNEGCPTIYSNPEQPKWIPVSKELPEKGGDYLVTISFDIGAEEPVREVYKGFFCALSQKWLNRDEDVIAWMPLPKPYREVEE